jgi:hypothetical protein
MTQLQQNYSIRTATHRYTEWGPKDTKGRELYDVRIDPEELRNLADDPQHSRTVAQLSRLLHDRIDAARKPPTGIEQIPLTESIEEAD